MTVVEARVDQRLIHGIVVNQWNSKLNPKRFMIIDDIVSNQPEIKNSMRMAKPSGKSMSIIDTQKAIANFKMVIMISKMCLSLSKNLLLCLNYLTMVFLFPE